MAQPNVGLSLSKEEVSLLMSALSLSYASSTRAARSAKAPAVASAHDAVASAIKALEVKVSNVVPV